MTANNTVCPYIVTGKEGTSYCRLAQSSYTHAQVMALVEALPVFFGNCLKVNADSNLDAGRKLFMMKEYVGGLHDKFKSLTPFTQQQEQPNE